MFMLNYTHMDSAKHTIEDSLQYLQRGPAAEVLRLLQRNGPMSAKQLQAELGVRSLNAVREQLSSLSAAGLIRANSVRGGTGRPAFVYMLSEKAQALFPKGYDVLLKLLLEELDDQLGHERLQQILTGVSVRLAEHYSSHSGGSELEQRLASLAEALAQRGTPITIDERDDAVILHEYTCPYFTVAQENDGVCQIEQQMLEQVLGRKARLTRRIVDGHAGCQFIVEGVKRPKEPSAENDNRLQQT
jgi:DeoR family transcriptional regulator, suf operon transcriptional repressor